MKTFDRCHAKPCGSPCFNLKLAIDSICVDFLISEIHRAIISYYDGAPIVFDSSIKYDPTSLNVGNVNDDLYVDFLFGVGGGENTIELKRQTYANILPSYLLPVGSSPWDDLYCIDKNGVVYVWNHDNPDLYISTPIANSFDVFFSNLWPDKPDCLDATYGIIESESWLDPDLPNM